MFVELDADMATKSVNCPAANFRCSENNGIMIDSTVWLFPLPASPEMNMCGCFMSRLESCSLKKHEHAQPMMVADRVMSLNRNRFRTNADISALSPVSVVTSRISVCS